MSGYETGILSDGDKGFVNLLLQIKIHGMETVTLHLLF